MWRRARPEDGEEIVSMCLALYREDPGFAPVEAGQVRETLAVFERQPDRGGAVVAEVGGRVASYSFLVPYWSNEVGGEVCAVDELYVRPEGRGKGLGSALFEAIDAGRFGSFTGTALGVTPGNARARRLYERLGFRAAGTTMVRRRAGPG
ncbi:MAG TPA: GNAT family N-acetyltransferase [Anaeromyxobacteraceae bacterium]|nr:GNAT family N-acetyltransferase [Anaeromyxobacteraceae bacterium]